MRKTMVAITVATALGVSLLGAVAATQAAANKSLAIHVTDSLNEASDNRLLTGRR